jgi:hypothetical protein
VAAVVVAIVVPKEVVAFRAMTVTGAAVVELHIPGIRVIVTGAMCTVVDIHRVIGKTGVDTEQVMAAAVIKDRLMQTTEALVMIRVATRIVATGTPVTDHLRPLTRRVVAIEVAEVHSRVMVVTDVTDHARPVEVSTRHLRTIE